MLDSYKKQFEAKYCAEERFLGGGGEEKEEWRVQSLVYSDGRWVKPEEELKDEALEYDPEMEPRVGYCHASETD